MNFKKILCSKDKKQISTKIGIIIILIVAFTAGMFAWKWEKMQNKILLSNFNIQKNINLQDNKKVNEEQLINKDLQQNIQEGTSFNKYTNSTHGFSFEYPKKLVIANESTESVFGLAHSNDEPWTINITVKKNAAKFSLDQAISEEIKRFSNYKVTIANINIDGIPTKKYSVKNHGNNGNVGVIIVKESNIITIQGDDSNASLKKVFETVINSFKFNK
jgi:hypothetical protein